MESRESLDLDFSRYLLACKHRWLPAVCVFVITITLAAGDRVFLAKQLPLSEATVRQQEAALRIFNRCSTFHFYCSAFRNERQVYKTPKEVREPFGYPVLGIILAFGKKAPFRHREVESTTPEIPVRNAPQSLISEIYRMIQANLKFLSSDKELKIIRVSQKRSIANVRKKETSRKFFFNASQ